MMHWSKTAFCLITLAGYLRIVSAAPVAFLPEERVTSDSRNYEMCRNPNHSMAVGSDGTAHLVFWDGYLATTPAQPSSVWYCRRDPSGRWAPPEMVDNSYTSGGIRLGGRHPSLVLRPNGEVRAFWHDYRHCTAAQKWMNNTEIYMDVRPSTGSFSANDVRLTNTSATHDGDNGYVPQAVAAPTGEIHVAWYDYHFDRNLADLFLMRSDAQGIFPVATSLTSLRLTNVSQRADGLSYTLPDLALDSSGNVHLVWTRDNQSGYGVYHDRLGTSGSLTTPTLLSPTGADFFDPPHIIASPHGDIFVGWTEHGGPAGDTDIAVARLRRGASSFDSPMRITPNPSNQRQSDLKVDVRGILHLVWVDERNGRDEIFHGVFDPDARVLVSETKVSDGEADASRPSIALDPCGQPFIAWMDYRNGQSSIRFRTAAQPTTARSSWNLYR